MTPHPQVNRFTIPVFESLTAGLPEIPVLEPITIQPAKLNPDHWPPCSNCRVSLAVCECGNPSFSWEISGVE